MAFFDKTPSYADDENLDLFLAFGGVGYKVDGVVERGDRIGYV